MIFFEYFNASLMSDSPKFGINWFRHHKSHKYKAFTVRLYIPGGEFDIDIVYSNVTEFKKIRGKK